MTSANPATASRADWPLIEPHSEQPQARPVAAQREGLPASLTRWLGTQASAPKRYTRGTHRSAAPAETLKRVRQLAARAGVTRIANVTGLDHLGLPVVMVCRPNARSLAVAQGKGLDLDSASISGLMEAIESHHAEHVSLPLRLASWSELNDRSAVIDVERLPRLSGGGFHPHRPTLWLEALELIGNHSLLVPYELVHTNFSLPLPTGSGSFMMSSNGLASGNHPLEALSHAICELVERDAMALFSARGGPSRSEGRLDLESVEDADCRRVLALLEQAEIAHAVWDVTSDTGIASFACIIVDRSPNVLRQLYYAVGSGCHPCREVALLRAITEAAQCRLTYIAGARDDADRAFFDRARDPDRVARMRRWVEAQVPQPRLFGDVPTRIHATFEADVAWELACLREAGIEQVAAVELTKPEFGIPVMRVIIAGLESLCDAPGYVPGARARAALQSGAR